MSDTLNPEEIWKWKVARRKCRVNREKFCAAFYERDIFWVWRLENLQFPIIFVLYKFSYFSPASFVYCIIYCIFITKRILFDVKGYFLSSWGKFNGWGEKDTYYQNAFVPNIPFYEELSFNWDANLKWDALSRKY